MRIVWIKLLDGSLCPTALGLLYQLEPSVLFHVEQKLRHPASIYRLSMEKVGDAFCRVAESFQIREIDEFTKSGTAPQGWGIDELLREQINLLRVMQEHVDELWLILKTLIDPSTACKNQIFADKYVIENKLPGAKAFQMAISGYRQSLRIANKLKHQQGHLRGVAIKTIKGCAIGYFLEEPDERGTLGPSAEIHPDQGAISFARDLLWHFFNVYLCSEKLSNTINKVVNSRGIVMRNNPYPGEKTWDRAVSLASKIPIELFPREVPRHCVDLVYEEEKGTLALDFPKRIHRIFPASILTTCSIKLDGISNIYKMPLP